MPVKLYDTTLRDGAQTEGISFTVEDKLKIVKLLDKIGIHYIEGGWPGSNPKDIEFFKQVKEIKLENAKMAAFGSTRRPGIKAEEDANLNAILESETPVACIFGKSWDFHVRDALKVSLEENLKMIGDSVKHLKSKGKEVFFDAEHFFDGYKANPDYALKTLKVAKEAGAEILVLCDTNGGSTPADIEKIMNEVKKKVKVPLGIHTHNDSEMAVANSIMAVKCGAVQVQGTINGYGERCGNANLSSIIPILKLKMGIDCISEQALKELTELSKHIAEIANLPLPARQPFVGRSAFTHKGGIHVSAVIKHPGTYEHIKPEMVGNERRVTVSELSGISNLIYKAKEYGVDLKKDTPETRAILQLLKDLEHQGYSFEEGEASFELLLKRTLGIFKPRFQLEGFKVSTDKRADGSMGVEASIRVKIGDQLIETSGTGNGPVAALDNAMRKALESIFPVIKEVKLTDYKVRVLDSEAGTAAKVRVIVESQDAERTWGTVGVSTNVIEASWQALLDSIEYKLMKG